MRGEGRLSTGVRGRPEGQLASSYDGLIALGDLCDGLISDLSMTAPPKVIGRIIAIIVARKSDKDLEYREIELMSGM